MSVANVWERLNAAIAECEQGAVESANKSQWLKGMSNGFQLALRVLAENGVVPAEPASNPVDDLIIPFKPKDHQ